MSNAAAKNDPARAAAIATLARMIETAKVNVNGLQVASLSRAINAAPTDVATRAIIALDRIDDRIMKTVFGYEERVVEMKAECAQGWATRDWSDC